MIYIYSADKVPTDARELRVFPLDFTRAEAVEPTVQGLLSPVGNAYPSRLDLADNMRTQESIVVVDIPSVIAAGGKLHPAGGSGAATSRHRSSRLGSGIVGRHGSRLQFRRRSSVATRPLALLGLAAVHRLHGESPCSSRRSAGRN